MSVLNRDEILESGKLKTEVVELEKGSVIVSELSGDVYMEVCKLSRKEDLDEIDMQKFQPLLICAAIVDESGNRIFSKDDVEIIKGRSKDFYFKILSVANKLNGLSGSAEKNSDDSQSSEASIASA